MARLFGLLRRAGGLLLLLAAATAVAGEEAAPTPTAPALSLEDVLRHSQSQDWELRLWAVRALANFPGEAAATRRLMQLAEVDTAWSVRAAACEALAGNEDRRVTPALAQVALTGDVRPLRLAAAEALSAQDPERASATLQGAMRGKAKLELIGLEALGLVGWSGNAPFFIRQAGNSEAEVRAAACRALGQIPAADPPPEQPGPGLRTLHDALEDRSPLVRLAAAEALANFGHPASVGPLARAYSGETEPAVSRRIVLALEAVPAAARNRRLLAVAPDVREEERLAQLLGELRVEEGLPHLARLATVSGGEARPAAAWALGRLESEEARALLRRLAADRELPVAALATEGLIRRRRAEDLVWILERLRAVQEEEFRLRVLTTMVRSGAFHQPGVLDQADPLFAPLLHSRDWRATAAVAQVLGASGDARAFEVLADLARENAWTTRASALAACWRSSNVQNLRPLAAGLGDEDPSVAAIARAALRDLTGQDFTRPEEAGQWLDEQAGFAPGASGRRAPEYSRGQVNVEALRAAEIVVVEGRYDAVEGILANLGIPCTVISPRDAETFGFHPGQLILVNCPGVSNSQALERIGLAVYHGAYLATMDWAVNMLTQPDLGALVARSTACHTANTVVPILAAAPGEPLLGDVFERNPEGLNWWLEVESYPIVVEDPWRVRVIVSSFEMQRRYGHSHMAVRFRWGWGQVFHTTSHFALQREALNRVYTGEPRRRYAVEHLGLTLGDADRLAAAGAFEQTDLVPVNRRYSMMQLLANFAAERRADPPR